jgi:hypothetical protein
LDVFSEREFCEECFNGLRKYRTVTQSPVGIMLGEPIVRHHIKQCSLCGRTYRCDELDKLKPLYGNYLFDIMAEVGKSRFLRHKQNQEIAVEIDHRFGITLPLSTINDLAGKFLDYSIAVHKSHVQEIRTTITAQGGIILYLDGTCEAGTDTLFTAIDGHTRWVLDSCKMRYENVRDISRFLTNIITLYGKPLAIVTDLSTHIANALKEVDPEIPHLICHYHFLVNVGEKLCAKHHGTLTKHFRRLKIQSSLKSLRNDLHRYAQREKALTPHEIKLILDDPQHIRTIEPSQAQRCLTYLMLHWLKDYKSDLKGEYFPFDLPSLALYRRGLKLVTFIRTILSQYGLKSHQWQSLQTVMTHLSPLLLNNDMRICATRLEKAEALFLKLRKVLRLAGTRNKPVLRQNARASAHEIGTIEAEMNTLYQSLLDIINNDTDTDRKEDAQIVKRYLDTYWSNLFDHFILRPGWSEPLIVKRTNFIPEHFFATKKRSVRRKVGNKKLSRNIQAMRPEEFIAQNLLNQEYIDLIYGGIHNLPILFARYQKMVLQQRKNSQNMHRELPLPINKKVLRKKNILGKVTQCANILIECMYDSTIV